MQEQCRLITKAELNYYKGLEKKLAIAVDALKMYEDKQNWDIRGVSFMKYSKGFTIARKAIKEIEELDK